MEDTQLEYHVAKFLKNHAPESFTRFALAKTFSTSPDYMRDVLRNLVNARHFEIIRIPTDPLGRGRPRYAYMWQQPTIEQQLAVVQYHDKQVTLQNAELKQLLIEATALNAKLISSIEALTII